MSSSQSSKKAVEPPLAKYARLTLAFLVGMALAHTGVTAEQALAFVIYNLEAVLTMAGLGTLAAPGPASKVQEWLESPTVRGLAERITTFGRRKE